MARWRTCAALVDQAHAAGHARHHGPGPQPHLRPASLVPGLARSVPPPARHLPRLVRVEPHRPALPRRAHHLPGHGKVQLDLGSAAQGLLLASFLLPPARPELRQPRRPAGDARRGPLLAGPWHRRPARRRRPLPVRAGGDQLREPARDPRLPEAAARLCGRLRPRQAAPVGGQPVAGGCAPLPGRRRRVPHELSLSAHAAHLPGPGPGRPDADRGDYQDPYAAHPRVVPVGHLPALPRRADPGNGHRRGAAVPVGLSTPPSRA